MQSNTLTSALVPAYYRNYTPYRLIERRSHSTFLQLPKTYLSSSIFHYCIFFPLNYLSITQSTSNSLEMRPRNLIQFILPSTILAESPDTSLGSTLNVTVIGARHNRSTLECWALQPGFKTSDQPGQIGTATLDLGSTGGNASYTVLTAGFDGGRHNAPALQ